MMLGANLRSGSSSCTNEHLIQLGWIFLEKWQIHPINNSINNTINEYLYDSPPMPATVSKPIPRLFSLILIFFAVTAYSSCGCYYKFKSITHFVLQFGRL